MAACSVTAAFAQLEGKRFVSATAGIDFSRQNDDEYPASAQYGYNFSANLGKFKTATKASGWNLSTSLSGQKDVQYRWGDAESLQGITGVGAGLGYFWQHYKHFSDKFGIFGGPQVNVAYAYSKQLESNSNGYFERKKHTISPQFGISAGAYYALSERWWLTASLGFVDLIYLSYTRENAESLQTGETFSGNSFSYKLTPNLALPSVSLGLRYFFKN